jgi:hypothetical protein
MVEVLQLELGPESASVLEPDLELVQERGPSQGQGQEPVRGQEQGPSQGQGQEPVRGQEPGPSQGQGQEPVRGQELAPVLEQGLGQGGVQVQERGRLLVQESDLVQVPSQVQEPESEL